MDIGEQLERQTFWPSKDAFDPHVHTTACDCGRPARLAMTADPLPSDHQFSRVCPRCTNLLYKKNPEDRFICQRCRWSEIRESDPKRRWTS